ncbi:MAG: ParA family protein [Alphaproteobacteria bacterium]
MSQPVILAIANQKGGVGKTTTAVNLGAALARKGKKTLIVDADPQGNASTGLGIAAEEREANLYGVLAGSTRAQDAIKQTSQDNLHILPANQDLAAMEVELVEAEARNFSFRDRLKEAADTYDVVLIDCPPALGLLTLNSLAWADKVLVPLQAEFFALEGLAFLLRTLHRVKRGSNASLQLLGVVLTMYDGRNRLAQQVENDVRTHLQGRVFETKIPRNVRLSEAPSHAQPIFDYDERSTGAQAYAALSDEIVSTLGL